MPIIYKFFLNKINIINFLIALIPLSLILGNLAININITLIIFTGLLIFGTNIFILDKRLVNYLIYFFFFYLLLITLLNNWNLLNENVLYMEHLIKSIFYLRFLLLFLIVNKLIENNNFNTKLFFISCAFFSFIISIDIIIQFIFKKNIFGYEILIDKPSSFFKEENIAGGFIQRFIYFFIFLIFIKNKTYNKNLIFITFIFFLIPIVLTANRMPMFIYIMSIFLFFLLEKNYKNIFFSIIVIFIIIFTFAKTTISNRLDADINTFFKDSKNIIYNAPKLFFKNEFAYNFQRNNYLIHFNTGVQIWKKNKIFGNGLKSFKLKCSFQKNQTCNTHPHNYFIEIMVDAGLIGILLIYSIFLIGMKNFLKNYYSNKNIENKMITSAFFLSIVFEFFPVRSTGSFFTTGNSIFIFLMLAIFLNLEKLNQLQNK